ncbi:MAG: DNA-directed RNA polymerase subunit omega [Negativicutes bacterium]
MIYPSLDHLLKKVDSKYTLVVLTARRAREVVAGDAPMVVSKSNKAVTIALEEIGADKITYERIKPIGG